MPDVYTVARSFARQVAQKERAASARMVKQYAETRKRIVTQARRLETELKKEKAEDARGRILRKKERLEVLRGQVEQELQRVAEASATAFTFEVQDARATGAENAAALIEQRLEDVGPAVGPTFAGLPTRAVEQAVGLGAEGSPLRELFLEAGEGVADRIIEEIAHSVATGRAVDKTARAINKALGQVTTRAMVIARTETLRAYREGTRATYEANADIVSGWMWTANLSLRTCAMCLAMDGEIFPVSEPLGTHPNCRCTMVPIVKGVHEDDQLPAMTGADYLRQLPPEEQDIILGEKKAELYRVGQLELEDLIGYREDPRWGPVRWERSLKELRLDKTR